MSDCDDEIDCDSIQSECEAQPSCSPLVFREPVGQNQDPGDGSTCRHYDTVVNGLVWPAVGYDVTVDVPDPTKYAVGQGVYVCGGYGWLKVSAVRSASISLLNTGFRSNVPPGTQTIAPVNIAPSGLPKPDLKYDDIKKEVEDAIEDEVERQVADAIDPTPEFPVDLIDVLESGRIPLWRRDSIDDNSTSKLGEQRVVSSSKGYLATLRHSGADKESVRFDILNPGGSSHGDLLGVTPLDYCGPDAPEPRKIDPETVDGNSSPAATFGLLGYRTEQIACDAGEKIKKIWQRLTKLFFHQDLLFEAEIDDDSLRIMVANKVGSTYKLAPLTLAENQVLAGDGNGGVKIQNVLDMVPPSVVAVPAEPPTMLAASGNHSNTITPHSHVPAPDEATHAICSLRLENANNSDATMTLAGVLRLKAGSATSDPNTVDTVAWIPIATPTSGFSITVMGTPDPAGAWSVKLIGYQCNR